MGVALTPSQHLLDNHTLTVNNSVTSYAEETEAARSCSGMITIPRLTFHVQPSGGGSVLPSEKQRSNVRLESDHTDFSRFRRESPS
jgi:hypothetical protein